MRLDWVWIQHQKVLFGQKAIQITADREAKLNPLEFAPRGGGTEAAKMRVHVQCIEALAEAFVESYIEAYQKAGLNIDRQDVEAIIIELRGHVQLWFASLRAQRDIGRFLTTQPSDPNSVVARARQTLILKANESILARERAAMENLEVTILGKLSESNVTFTLAQLRAALPECRDVDDKQIYSALEGLQARGFISTRTLAGPFLITRQGKDHVQSLRHSTAQNREMILGDKYEIHGQTGAVGPYAQAHGLNFIQIWNEQQESVDLVKLAEELAALRQVLATKATAPEHYVAIGEVASAEVQARSGNGPGVVEHLSKVGKWVLDFARETSAQVAAALIVKASLLSR